MTALKYLSSREDVVCRIGTRRPGRSALKHQMVQGVCGGELGWRNVVRSSFSRPCRKLRFPARVNTGNLACTSQVRSQPPTSEVLARHLHWRSSAMPQRTKDHGSSKGGSGWVQKAGPGALGQMASATGVAPLHTTTITTPAQAGNGGRWAADLAAPGLRARSRRTPWGSSALWRCRA